MKKLPNKIFILIFVVLLALLIKYWYNGQIADEVSDRISKYSMEINKYIKLGIKQGNFNNYCYSNIYSLININITTNQRKILSILNETLNTNYNYKRKYIFSPVTPAGEAILWWTDTQTNFYVKTKAEYWLWGRIYKNTYILRRIIGRNVQYHDKNISWYYQCPLENLSPDELEKEKKYRKEKGLPELK